MEIILLFLAAILSGFVLMGVELVSFLSFLGPIFDIIGSLTMIVFSLAFIFKALKALFGK
jgi:hypothetical protein